jgi:TonB family protein
MFGAAKTSAQKWKFQPAFEGRTARPSRLTVAFVYRPANYPTFGAVPPKDFTPVFPSGPSDDGSEGYTQIGILSFAYPDYPVNSVVWGSVVLQATVDSAGNVRSVKTLHDMANFDRFAQGALKNWRFRAAMLHGRPVTSNAVVAFIFQPRSSSN